MIKNNIDLRICSILILTLFITRVLETPFLILLADFRQILQYPFDVATYKLSFTAVIARLYSVSYFLGIIGALGLFFVKKWSRVLLIIYAVFEIAATITGFHEGTKIMHNLGPRFYLYYNVQGIMLALTVLTLTNMPSTKSKLH